MFRLTSFALLAVVAAAPIYAAACSTGPSNLVSNCGFETGDFTSWTLSGYDSGPGFNGIDYGVDSSDAHSGSFGAYLGGLGGVLNLSQQLTTIPGATYNITFWLAQSPTPSAPYLESFNAMFGTSTLTMVTNVPNLSFTLYSYQALASSATTSLEFGFRDDTGFFSLDDVTVSAMSAPEPATSHLWISGALLALLTLAITKGAITKGTDTFILRPDSQPL